MTLVSFHSFSFLAFLSRFRFSKFAYILSRKGGMQNVLSHFDLILREGNKSRFYVTESSLLLTHLILFCFLSSPVFALALFVFLFALS
ncbi:hypothetical protein K2173_017400 [Erythroxylum novogranatense]|uniref:Uncharacterized protein n=1 Tax=Erythroxylum novogranatense TaxID=1862640 RepID=A0AAV8TLR7_9ROSI|nr:hypothetical protein K2173_017400 [Erythroxylum novogranatense]